MSDNSSEQIFKDIISTLENNHLLQALYLLKVLIDRQNQWQLRSEWDELSQAYHSMLSYISQDVLDEKRHIYYTHFLAKAYHLAVQTYRESQIQTNQSDFYQSLKQIKQQNCELFSLKSQIEKKLQQTLFAKATSSENQLNTLEKELKDIIDQTFAYIWTSISYSNEEAKLLKELLSLPNLQEQHKLLLLSALSLSSIQVFDTQKASLLIELYQENNTALKIRALVGIVFFWMTHQQFIQLFPQLKQSLENLAQDATFQKHFTLLQHQLLIQVRVNDAEQKIQNEIIPTIIKSSPFDSKQSIKIDEIEDILNNDELSNDILNNPESTKIREQVEKLMEMQHSGIDVYYTSFRNLKRYPFFKKTINWFRPYSIDYCTSSNQNRAEKEAQQIFVNNSGLCDSDKYSLSLLINSLPFSQSNMIKQQLDQMLGGFTPPPSSISKDIKNESEILRHYLQDCYRYWTLFSSSTLSNNPFDGSVLLFDYQSIRETIHLQPNSLLELAQNTSIQKEWKHTIQLIDLIPTDEPLSFELYQLKGTAYVQLKQYKEAIPCLENALTLQPKSTSTLRQLAACYRNNNNLKGAISTYYELCKLQPNDCSALFHYGESLFTNGSIDSALEQFYKIEYLKPNSQSVLRAIGWCALSSHQPDLAEEYYHKLIHSKNAKSEDFINAGHTAWVNHHIKEAISRYRQYQQRQDSPKGLFSIKESDAKLLAQYGIETIDIRLMTDYLNELSV